VSHALLCFAALYIAPLDLITAQSLRRAVPTGPSFLFFDSPVLVVLTSIGFAVQCSDQEAAELSAMMSARAAALCDAHVPAAGAAGAIDSSVREHART
jgi:hypothetical protein